MNDGHLNVSPVTILILTSFLLHRQPAPTAQLVECPLRGTGGHGFDPGPRHTKVIKNGTTLYARSFLEAGFSRITVL